jgi:septal ring-binding cell division protein DamX
MTKVPQIGYLLAPQRRKTFFMASSTESTPTETEASTDVAESSAPETVETEAAEAPAVAEPAVAEPAAEPAAAEPAAAPKAAAPSNSRFSEAERTLRKERVAKAKDALARSVGVKGDHVAPARASLKMYLQRLNEPNQPDDARFELLINGPFTAPPKKKTNDRKF